MRRARLVPVWPVLLCAVGGLASARAAPAQDARRPMTPMDVLRLREVAEADLSADGRWLVYALEELDWAKNERVTDLYLVSTRGVDRGAEPRRLTYTPGVSERAPRWSPDGRYIGFVAKRGEKPQLYLVRPDGGEARQVTRHREGVRAFAWSRDGRWLAYDAAEREDGWQIYLLPGDGEGEPRPLTRHATPVASWAWSPPGDVVFFTAPERVDTARREARRKGFDVVVVEEPEPPRHLWRVTVETGAEQRLTQGDAYSVGDFVVSATGLAVGFLGRSTDRHAQASVSHDVYLYDIRRGRIDRLTRNAVAERQLSFSPDGRWFAFVAPAGFEFMRLDRIYVRALEGGELRTLATEFPWDADLAFWSKDGRALYFVTGVGVNTQLFEVRLETGTPRRRSEWEGFVRVAYDEDADRVLVRSQDARRPEDLYVVEPDRLHDPRRWVRLSRANPQVDSLALAEVELVRWTSTDGRTVEGLLYRPVGVPPGRRAPLVVQVHGGPASAYMNRFPGSWGTYAHVLAGMGYAVFQPNYRGSSNYGERWQMEIAGDYFRQAYEDILAGVDTLVARGVAHADSLAMMGWSAGGHWSNWTLTQTSRFKAISTGAGAANWISLYAQTDVRSTREFYFRGPPYGRWEAYWRVSPLHYVEHARTPTLIHFGEKDERIPLPQGQELHRALVAVGVPTEFLVYPGQPHGLRSPRHQLVKMTAEIGWFERWVRGRADWLDWAALLATLPADSAAAPAAAGGR